MRSDPRIAAPPLLLLIVALTLGACSSGPPPLPSAEDAPRRSVNSESSLAALAARAAAAGQPSAAELERRARLEAIFAESQQRRWRRAPDPDTFGDLPGNPGARRIITVNFERGSTEFRPDPGDRARLLELIASATRAEIRGRTDGEGGSDADVRIARARTLAAKRYLIDRGLPGHEIATTYAAGNDFVGDNSSEAGRARNRRVEIEFFLPRLPDRPAWLPIEPESEPVPEPQSVAPVEPEPVPEPLPLPSRPRPAWFPQP